MHKWTEYLFEKYQKTQKQLRNRENNRKKNKAKGCFKQQETHLNFTF